LLLVVDSTTLWAEAFPSKTTGAEETASILYREIICGYGVMKAIETDGGTAFRNKLMTELCKLLKIRHIISSPRHAMGNLKVERTNRSLMSYFEVSMRETGGLGTEYCPSVVRFQGYCFDTIGHFSVPSFIRSSDDRRL